MVEHRQGPAALLPVALSNSKGNVMAVKCTPTYAFTTTKTGFEAEVTYKVTQVLARKLKQPYSENKKFSWTGTDVWEGLSDTGKKYFAGQLENKFKKLFDKKIKDAAGRFGVMDNPAGFTNPRWLKRVLAPLFKEMNDDGSAVLESVKKQVLKDIQSTSKATFKAAKTTVRGLATTASGTKDFVTGDVTGVRKAIRGVVKTGRGVGEYRDRKIQIRKDGDIALVKAKDAINEAWDNFGKTEVLIRKLKLDSDQIAVDTETVVNHYVKSDLPEKQVEKLLKSQPKTATS